jgi:hypothetical protein
MKKNTFAYLGLLGLLGLVGIPTGQYALFGFFGFFGFFSLLRTKNDELLQENVSRAAANGFAVSTIGLAITMVLVATLETITVAIIGIAATFVVQMLTYTFTLSWYEAA